MTPSEDRYQASILVLPVGDVTEGRGQLQVKVVSHY